MATVTVSKSTTVKGGVQVTSAAITQISKYRALMLVLATMELGWKYQQVGTQVDQYTKGQEVITLSWGNTQLKEYIHSKGKALVAHVQGTQGAKLQRAQTSLGKPMELTAKWPKLTPKKVEELEALASATFKVVEPKAQA